MYTFKKKTFSPPPLFKVCKKDVQFSFAPAKNILMSSFSFWFQLIQRIDQLSNFLRWTLNYQKENDPENMKKPF